MRPDNRGYNELRPVKIIPNFISYASGSALIEFGNTKVICTATLEDKVPAFFERYGQRMVNRRVCNDTCIHSNKKTRESTKGKLEGRTQEIQEAKIGRSLRPVLDLDIIGERNHMD